VFKITNAKVREWPKGLMSLKTVPITSIQPSEEDIELSRSSLPDIISQTLQFPPLLVIVVEFQLLCPNCGERNEEQANVKLFKCLNCQSMMLKSKVSNVTTY